MHGLCEIAVQVFEPRNWQTRTAKGKQTEKKQQIIDEMFSFK
jgi:hypothetical protein